jgi:opacity protein-like surface antigen
MRTAILSTSAIALATIFSPAYAADLGKTAGDPTASNYEAPVSFTGFYVGGRIGYGNANHDLTVEAYQNAAPEVVVPASCTSGELNSTGTGCSNNGTFVSAVAPTCSSGFELSSDKKSCIKHIHNSADEVVPANPGSSAKCVGGKLNQGGTDCAAGGSFVPSSVIPAIDSAVQKLFNLDGLNSAGFIGGAQVGYDQQIGRFVIGVFGSYDWSNMETTLDVLPGTPLAFGGSYEKQDEWSLGARAGILVNPKTLTYLSVAYTETTYELNGGGSSKEFDYSGVSVGGGIEYALTNNIFVGLDYTHTFYGEETLFDSNATAPGAVGIRVKDDLDEDKVMLTLKAKLNSGLGF